MNWINITLIQEIGLTESLSNWKTFTITLLYVITQTLETVNDELELDYLHLLKTNFIIKLKHL